MNFDDVRENMNIDYKVKYDVTTGIVSYMTECPERKDVKVGSNGCQSCKYFAAIYPKGYNVSCKRPVEVVSERLEGFF